MSHVKIWAIALFIQGAIVGCTGADPTPSVLSSDATVVWSVELPGDGLQTPRAMAIHDGGIVVVGKVDGSMSFSTKAPVVSARADGFVAMFDRDGTPRWSTVLRGAGVGTLSSVHISGSRVIVGGSADGAATLGNRSLTGGQGERHGFAAALDLETGGTLWLQDLAPLKMISVGAITSDGVSTFLAGAATPQGPESFSVVASLSNTDGTVRWNREVRGLRDRELLPNCEITQLILDQAGLLTFAGVYTGAGLTLFGPNPSLGPLSAFAARMTKDGSASGMMANVFRREHESHNGHSHTSLIDKVTVLRASSSGAILVGGSQFQTVVHDGDVPWLSRAVWAEMLPHDLLTSTDVRARTLVALAPEAATEQPRAIFALSTVRDPLGNQEEASARASIEFFERADGERPNALAWLKNDDYDLNAVSVADGGGSLIVLLMKRSPAADGGAVKGTTVLAELEL